MGLMDAAPEPKPVLIGLASERVLTCAAPFRLIRASPFGAEAGSTPQPDPGGPVTDEERALLVAGLLMDYPQVTRTAIIDLVDRATTDSSLPRDETSLVTVEESVRALLDC